MLISGHTHGGQICLPGGGIALEAMESWTHYGMFGYTSRGTPVRFNPEITLQAKGLGQTAMITAVASRLKPSLVFSSQSVQSKRPQEENTSSNSAFAARSIVSLSSAVVGSCCSDTGPSSPADANAHPSRRSIATHLMA